MNTRLSELAPHVERGKEKAGFTQPSHITSIDAPSSALAAKITQPPLRDGYDERDLDCTHNNGHKVEAEDGGQSGR